MPRDNQYGPTSRLSRYNRGSPADLGWPRGVAMAIGDRFSQFSRP